MSRHQSQPLSPDVIQLKELVSEFSSSRPFDHLEVIATLGVGGFGRVELVRADLWWVWESSSIQFGCSNWKNAICWTENAYWRISYFFLGLLSMSAAQPVLQHLVESLQRVQSCTLFILLVVSAVTPSINTSNLHRVRWLMLFSILFSSHHVNLGFIFAKNLFFRIVQVLLDVFWQTLIWPSYRNYYFDSASIYSTESSLGRCIHG